MTHPPEDESTVTTRQQYLSAEVQRILRDIAASDEEVRPLYHRLEQQPESTPHFHLSILQEYANNMKQKPAKATNHTEGD